MSVGDVIGVLLASVFFGVLGASLLAYNQWTPIYYPTYPKPTVKRIIALNVIAAILSLRAIEHGTVVVLLLYLAPVLTVFTFYLVGWYIEQRGRRPRRKF